MDHDKFSSNLFYIKAGQDQTLEVEHSATLPTKRRAVDGLISPKTHTTQRILELYFFLLINLIRC